MERPSDTVTPGPQEDALVALMPKLLSAARRLTRSRAEAEDLVQEALLQVWTRQRCGARIDHLPAYALTTLRNRTRRAGYYDDTPALNEEVLGCPSEAPGRVAFGQVMEAIAALPDPQQRLIRRLLEEDLSYAQLAEAEGIPIGTVMSRLSRARTRLRAACGLETGEDVSSLL